MADRTTQSFLDTPGAATAAPGGLPETKTTSKFPDRITILKDKSHQKFGFHVYVVLPRKPVVSPPGTPLPAGRSSRHLRPPRPRHLLRTAQHVTRPKSNTDSREAGATFGDTIEPSRAQNRNRAAHKPLEQRLSTVRALEQPQPAHRTPARSEAGHSLVVNSGDGPGKRQQGHRTRPKRRRAHSGLAQSAGKARHRKIFV